MASLVHEVLALVILHPQVQDHVSPDQIKPVVRKRAIYATRWELLLPIRFTQ